MINKLYEWVKCFLKENTGFLMGLVGFYLVINIPLPYYIHAPGSLINIADKVQVRGEYREVGSLNLTYVSEIKGNVLTGVMAFLLPHWDLVKKDEVYTSNETYEEAHYRNRMFLTEANQNAVFIAYQTAQKEIKINGKQHYLVYIDEQAVTDLKIGDELLTIVGEEIDDVSTYQKIVQAAVVGERLQLMVRDKKGIKQTRFIDVINYQGVKLTGVYFITKYDYEVSPTIRFTFKESEAGASGGLMTALSIYNKLTAIDITNGKRIVGTGTIDEFGNVGAISGIKYKIKGAVRAKADLFFVPLGANYEEALALKEKNKYNMQVIGVSTFVDALNYLKEMKEE